MKGHRFVIPENHRFRTLQSIQADESKDKKELRSSIVSPEERRIIARAWAHHSVSFRKLASLRRATESAIENALRMELWRVQPPTRRIA